MNDELKTLKERVKQQEKIIANLGLEVQALAILADHAARDLREASAEPAKLEAGTYLVEKILSVCENYR